MRFLATFLGVSFLCFIAFFVVDDVNARYGWSWTSDSPTILQNHVLPSGYDVACQGRLETEVIVELQASRKICFFGKDRLKIGYFSSGGPYQAAVRFPFSSDVHVLEGICEGQTCYYSAEKDMLITKQPVGQSGQGLVVYLHASRRIGREVSLAGVVRYVFDSTDPDYELRSDDGYYVSTPSFNVSENGHWIVAELQNKGLAVIDTASFAARQITTNGYLYGFGMDPIGQLAISNDGTHIVSTGLNAGFSVIAVSPDCGQRLTGDLAYKAGSVICSSSDMGIGLLFPGFRSAQRPRFFGDGQQLELIVRVGQDVIKKVTLLAHGAVPPHKLRFISLGDSFSSGEGETDDAYYLDGTNSGVDRCHISQRAYPLLVARSLFLDTSAVSSVACSGAKIGDISGLREQYWGQGGRLGGQGLNLSESNKDVAQQEALDTFIPGRALQADFLLQYTPDVIMLSIGGNDAGLMGKLRACAGPGTCQWADGTGLAATANEIKRLFTGLKDLFVEIKEDNTLSTLYIVGYPDIIQPSGRCDAITDALFDYSERQFMHESVLYLNQIIAAAASAADLAYIDIESSMEGHRLCEGSSEKAMNALRFAGDYPVINALPWLKIIGAESFHPTPLGHERIADRILTTYPTLKEAIQPVEANTEPSPYWGTDSVDVPEAFGVDFATVVDKGAMQLSIFLTAGLLQPSTPVKVQIDTERDVMATIYTDEDGVVKADTLLLGEIGPGVHTLHLFGANKEGTVVDIYQFIEVPYADTTVPVEQAPKDSEVRRDKSPRALSMLQGGATADVLGRQSLSQNSYRVPAVYAETADEQGYWRQNVLIAACVTITGLTVLWILSRIRRWVKPGS